MSSFFLLATPTKAEENSLSDDILVSNSDSILKIFLDNYFYVPIQPFDSLFSHYDRLKKIYINKKDYNKFYLLNTARTYFLILRNDALLAMNNNNEIFLYASIRKDKVGLLDSYVGMAHIYASFGMYDESLDYYQKAWDVCEKGASPNMKMQVLIHLISLAIINDDTDIATNYIKILKPLNKKDIRKSQCGYINITLARYYYKIDKIERGDSLLTSVKQILDEHPSKTLESFLHYTRGVHYYDVQDYDKALKEFDLFLLLPISNKLHYLDILEKKAETKYVLREKDEAFELLDSLAKKKDDNIKRMYSTNLDDLSLKYKSYEVQREISISKKRVLKLLLLSILFLLIIVVIFIVVIKRNTKEIKKKTKELDKSREAAIKAIKNKVTILSNMSHEVRTPLNAIIGFSNILLSDEMLDDDTMIECRNIIRNNAHMLQHLIAETTSEISIRYKCYDIVDICKSIIKTIITSYKPEVDMRFVKNEAIGDSLFILIDRYRLNQVIVNILTNSIKFTEQGFIELKLDIQDDNTLIFSVTDTGKGVSEEIKNKLFERYINKDTTGKGTGLGLNISYQIVSLMGGKLWLDESYKTGARFIFTLPLTRCETTTKK